ncbi:MAG: urate hydroxylase PuuD [Gammaproteobacteria bacterium]|nr:urate hydroxylase PuuD [Gammaproteobacteria bacterium]
MEELALLQGNALAFLFRWIHLLAGVAWIGLLWYFNFVQGEYFKEAEASAKTDAIRKLVPRALWWFRWGAMFTFISGLAMLGAKHLTGYGILVGSTLGTLMFLNVWLIIWPNQKIVIASAEQTAAGGEADPAAAGALAKAALASRTNTLFSIPMLFFMASSVHLAQLATPITSAGILSLIVVFGVIALLEVNAVAGKQGPMTTVRGVIHMGLLLTLVLYLGIDIL